MGFKGMRIKYNDLYSYYNLSCPFLNLITAIFPVHHSFFRFTRKIV